MENLKLHDFTEYKFLSGIQYSPDGKHLAYVVHQASIEKNQYLSNIYIYREETNSSYRLTTGNNERIFFWKDDKTIVFASNRDEEVEDCSFFYEINIYGGEAIKSFEIPLNVLRVEFIDQDNLIMTSIYNHNKIRLDGKTLEDQEELKIEIEDNKDYEILDEIPYFRNGVGFTNKKRNRLSHYNISTGQLKFITDGFTEVMDFKLDEKKENILIISTAFMDKMQVKSDLSLYNIGGDNLRTLNPKNIYKYEYADFLEDKIIFFASKMDQYGLNENPHIFKLDPQTKEITQISTDRFDRSLGSSVGSDIRYGGSNSAVVDGNHLYFISTEQYSSNISRVDLDGNLEKVTSGDGSIDSFTIKNTSIKFVGLRDLRLQEIYSIVDGKEIRLTNFNNWVLDSRKLSQPEHILFETSVEEGEGDRLDGWIMKPVDFSPERKYPTILNIHGGPKTVFGNVFHHEMQFLANAGYVILFMNPRGSDGKGNEFADIRGKYGSIDYDDLMNFVDLALENYEFIDEDKLGVMGGSYGGFMTNWIVGHSKRFEAAVSQRSISNWFSFFGTSDIGYFFSQDQIQANPWENPDKFWDHSPLKYADKVVTPTLFLHSTEDYRCWIPEGMQMYTALKYHGVDTRLCLFKGENHDLSRTGLPKHRIKRLKEIVNWFDKYLK